MANPFVIDAHVHTYKTPEIGRQALAGFDVVGCCGTPEELVPIMEEAGIRKAVQCNMTPARSMFEAALTGFKAEPSDEERRILLESIAARVKRRNEWTCQMAGQYDALVPFLSLDPIMGETTMMEELLDKLDHHGAMGLKIHPGEGRFMPDDPMLIPIYEVLERRGLPVISHAGPDVANPDPRYARPTAFIPVLERFPGLKVVLAHLGGFYDESVDVAQKHANLFFDTSAALPGDEAGQPLILGKRGLSNDEAVALIRRIGVDRVMFGTDYPWFHPARDVKRFRNLGFSEQELEALLGGNAKRILNL